MIVSPRGHPGRILAGGRPWYAAAATGTATAAIPMPHTNSDAASSRLFACGCV